MNDSAFTALANEDRRQLLSMLAVAGESDPPVRVPDDLLVTGSGRVELATRLHHVHLPRPASMDYVEWDPDSGAVRRGPAFDELEPLLDVLQAQAAPSSD